MKTTFSRTFLTVTVILLLALLSIGFFLRTLLRDYLTQTAFSQLTNDAQVISRLTAAHYADNSLTDMDFFINLEIAAAVSEADTVICDKDGKILLCSDAPLGCQHQGMVIGQDYLQRILRNGTTRDTGEIQRLYSGSRHVVATTVENEGSVLGIVIVSSPVSVYQAVLQKMTDFYIMLSVLAVLAAVLAVSVFVHRQSQPLRQMAKTARAFGHGELDARVPIRKGYSQEVGELALAFNSMAASLQQSENQRREFVANVSHELKTPMTTIGGYVDGILDGTIPPEKSRHYMQIVSDETKRLSRLVRSMLDISQLQSEAGIPAEKRTRFDLSETIGQVLLTFEQKITAKNLNVEVDIPPHPVYTNANRDYITQVVYNLLDNAVKFCPENATVGIRLREARGKVYVSVYNDGKTIPAEELPLVFDRFHKLDKSRSENRDGWGLGLYIVKTIVCSHGENISVTSRDGRTEFTFTMPLVI
jgi:signal transduction histidine kinase